MMDEIRELLHELKIPAVAIGLGLMICGILLLYNITFKIERLPVKPLVKVDYCWISYRARATDQYGLPHIIWTNGFGRCSDLDRYENT
jgi:hypothetical protein